jgi:thiol:disulfide interchange protein DsbG
MARRLSAALAAILLGLCASAGATATASAPGAVFHTPLRDLPSTLTRLLQTTQTLRAVRTGPGHGPEITVFFDPNCPACSHLWPRVAPQVQQVRIRWIPVAWAQRDSLGVAAAILDAPDPSRALARNESGFDEKQEHGALMAAYTISPATRAAIQRNTTVWRDALGMLPTLLYRDDVGVHLFVGTPSAAQWRDILRHIDRSTQQLAHSAAP